MEQLKKLIKTYVQEHADEESKLLTSDLEIYNHFVLFSKKQEREFFLDAEKQIGRSQQEIQKLYAEYSRSFAEELTADLKRDIIKRVQFYLGQQPKMSDYQISHCIYDEYAKQSGVSAEDCTKYVKYCVKQINKYSNK